MRIIHSNDEESHVYQVAERVELSCELSRPDGPVHWYKDGEEVEENEGLLVESEGPHRRLVIPSAQVQDSGEFVCDAGGDSAFFNITVTGKIIILSYWAKAIFMFFHFSPCQVLSGGIGLQLLEFTFHRNKVGVWLGVMVIRV